ncbi:BTB/POZ domain-containing protein At1g04390 [Linum perenne]
MMKSSKQATVGDKVGRTARVQTLHRRLHSALSLGTRFHDGEGWKWKSTDIEIQRHVLRAISSFLDSITPELSRNVLVRDSVADIVRVLVWILQYKSQAAVSFAAIVVVKLLNKVPNEILKPCLLDMVRPLSSLLSGYSLQVSTSCAFALSMILSGLNVKGDHNKVWEMLTDSNSVHLILSNMSSVSAGVDAETTENFLEMISLLNIILHLFPPSRYCVWSNVRFMHVLGIMSLRPDSSIQTAVLKLYIGIALCCNGAKKLLQDEQVLGMVVSCMDKSYPPSVRIEGFRLAKCLATNEEGCLRMMSLFCEPMVKAIIDGMSVFTFRSRKADDDQIQMSLLVEACQLAHIVCWRGEHHNSFWKHGIDHVLVHLLSDYFRDGLPQGSLSLEKLIPIAQEAVKLDFLVVVRPYVWDILGWLAAHCMEGIDHDLSSHEVHILIACACLSFVESIQKSRQMCLNDAADILRGGSATRAVLMMIYSPCKYFESKAKLILTEILKPVEEDLLKHLLRCISLVSLRNTFGTPDLLAVGVNLMALTCYSGLPPYQSCIVESGGISILTAFISWCMRHKVHVKRLGLAQHDVLSQKTCCWEDKEEWEGDEMLLLCSLWGLAELFLSGCVSNLDMFEHMDYPQDQFLDILRDICMSSSSHGLRWYSAYMLSYFGLYGFPCKLGQRIGKALLENEYADMQVILRSGQSMRVHRVILAIRCPSLLPAHASPPSEKFVDSNSARSAQQKQQVVLGSSCDYLRAMFQSGMQESHSKTIKVPVGWEAMIKLVHWFYTDELLNPPSGCLWLNMGAEEKLQALQPYLELYWLSDFWFLETVQDTCYQVIVSRMGSDANLSIKLLHVAANLSLWKLAEVAADLLAPSYRQLCQSGDLELLDEDLVDMIRAASVRISRDSLEVV